MGASTKRRKMATADAKRRLFKGRARRPCAYCGTMLTLEQATFDHVVPLSAGGYDKTKNGAIACRACNQAKASMPADEFRAMIQGASC